MLARAFPKSTAWEAGVEVNIFLYSSNTRTSLSNTICKKMSNFYHVCHGPLSFVGPISAGYMKT